jgi:hypothetical protein
MLILLIELMGKAHFLKYTVTGWAELTTETAIPII